MSLFELNVGSAGIPAFPVDSVVLSQNFSTDQPASRELTLQVIEATEDGHPQRPVKPQYSDPPDDVSSVTDPRGSPSACQLISLVDELTSAANHLSQLSDSLTSMSPADAEASCAHAIRALLTKLNKRYIAKSDISSRKSSIRICVENYIRHNLSSKDINPSGICKHLEIPRSTLYKAFMEIGGVAKYIQDQRLDVAKSLLMHPEEHRSLNQIADCLGFETGAQFSKAFRRRFGGSPREIRMIGSHVAAVERRQK